MSDDLKTTLDDQGTSEKLDFDSRVNCILKGQRKPGSLGHVTSC